MVLSVFNVWSPKSTSPTNEKSPQKNGDEPAEVSVKPVVVDTEDTGPKDVVDASGVTPPIGIEGTSQASEGPSVSSTEPAAVDSIPAAENLHPKDRPAHAQPRFSFRSLGFFNGPKETVSHEQEILERQKVKVAAKRESLTIFSRSADRRVTRNALAVQRLIVGPGEITAANAKARPAPVSRTQLTRIKSELMKPKSANRLIAKLRELPVPQGQSQSSKEVEVSVKSTANLPIHAVCLENTEADVQSKHFSKLNEESIICSSLDALTSLFNELHIVDLLAAPDLGFGQPGDGEGLLAGAVPTAETVIEGAAKLTPQLMALGFATGKAILPDHTSLHPPTDRMSVLTYWWGLELCLPPPSLVSLAQAPNIAHQVINFLSAMSLMYNGVREVLPFVRYIGQFVDFEWAAIQKQDEGKGVVCAATWIMPAAMVPRSWDFPDSPPTKRNDSTADEPSAPEVPRSGQRFVEDIPTLLVTPPSVIKNTPSQETPVP